MTFLQQQLAAAAATKPAKPKRKSEEHGFQNTLVDLLELILPVEAIVTSIDHANAASVVTGALRKARGVKKGIPDVWIIWAKPSSVPPAPIIVTLETKATDGRLEKEQEFWRDALIALGCHWAAPRTLEQAIAAIEAADIPLRGHML